MRILVLYGQTKHAERVGHIRRLAEFIGGVLKTPVTILGGSLHNSHQDLWVGASKAIRKIPDAVFSRAQQTLLTIIAAQRPDCIITYDPATAQILTGAKFGNIQTTEKIAGSTGTIMKVPFLIVDDPFNIYNPAFTDEDKAIAEFQMAQQIHMLLRGHRAPPFKFYIPENEEQLEAVEKLAATATLIATDIETQGHTIACVGFTLVFNPDMSDAVNFTIPIRWHDEAPAWTTPELGLRAWQTVLTILSNDVPKAQKNGMFDNTQYALHGIAMNHYAWDPEILAWAMWPSLPKSLHALASVFCDEYSYWKDDGKVVDEMGRAIYRIPKDPTAYVQYLEYCARDCWYTARLTIEFWKLMLEPDSRKFMSNYVRAFLLETGPAAYMSWHGLPLSPEGMAKNDEFSKEVTTKLREKITLWTSAPWFNPSSPAHLQHFVYGVMGVPPIARKGKSTDRRVLNTLAEQYSLIAPLIKNVQEYKYARMAGSRFGSGVKAWHGWDGRGAPWYFTKFSATRTTTARFASSKSIIGGGTGQNLQNVPVQLRGLLKAPDGHALLSVDLTAADVWHVAAKVQDPTLIETVMGGGDSHSIHAAAFFGYPVEDVLRGKKKKEAWVVDDISGIRQLVKKVVHGTNYGLMPYGMVFNISLAAARGLLQRLVDNPASRAEFYAFLKSKNAFMPMYEDPERFKKTILGWSPEKAALGCEYVQGKYLARYPILAQYRSRGVIKDLLSDNGVVTAYGPYFVRMLAPLSSPALHRFALAAYGQSGTAGSINNALLRFWMNPKFQALHDRGARLVMQVHDELVFALPLDDLELAFSIMDMMTITSSMGGMQYTIPVEAKLSVPWSKSGAEVRTGMTQKELFDAVKR